MWTLKQAKLISWWLSFAPLIWGCSSLQIDVPSRSRLSEAQLRDFSELSADRRFAFIATASKERTASFAREASAGLTLDEIRNELSKQGVAKAQILDAGVYGKVGSKVIFVADRRRIPDYDRLYWVMVRVLSEKYGCFIRRKITEGDMVQFSCRDQRRIVMKRSAFKKYLAFQSRQYDARGREIVIKHNSLADNNKSKFAAGLPAQGYRRSP